MTWILEIVSIQVGLRFSIKILLWTQKTMYCSTWAVPLIINLSWCVLWNFLTVRKKKAATWLILVITFIVPQLELFTQRICTVPSN